MAYISINQHTRARLVAIKGVTILDRPVSHDPALAAMVFHHTRLFEVCDEADGTSSARYHIGPAWAPEPWLHLADGVPQEAAFAAVLAFVSLTAPIPQHYAPEHDVALRAAAAEVHGAFAVQLSLAA